MRVLHTADWHLGKTIEGRDRRLEQEAFVDEICCICDDEAIELVLIAGDVFQNTNPSAAAEQLFYEAINRMAKNGTRAVVVIAGNHDNPERLCASSPLADRLGITLIGLPKDALHPYISGIAGRVARIECGPSWLEIGIPNCDHTAVLAALPYPSEGRLRQLIAQTLDETEMQHGYNELIKGTMNRLASKFRPSTVNLAMSHLFVRGGIESGVESENYIQQVGGVYAVDPLAFPSNAQYIALGHLHRPQAIGSVMPGRYAGSPLQYSFAEAGHAKSVTVVDVVPGSTAKVKEIFLSSGKPLVKWHATQGLQQIYNWLDEGKDKNAWIDAEVHITQMLTHDEIHRLRTLHPGFINIRPVVHQRGEQKTPSAQLSCLSPEDMFERFFARQQDGLKPDEGLVRLFLELTQEIDDTESMRDKEHIDETD